MPVSKGAQCAVFMRETNRSPWHVAFRERPSKIPRALLISPFPPVGTLRLAVPVLISLSLHFVSSSWPVLPVFLLPPYSQVIPSKGTLWGWERV